MSGGNQESGRINQIIADARRCAVKEALAKAKSTYCCPTAVINNQVPSSDSYLAGKMNARSGITQQQATAIASASLKGVPESVRINRLQQATVDAYSLYSDPTRRFIQYEGPKVQIQCPPLPTEITNAFLPKPSVLCAPLFILAAPSE